MQLGINDRQGGMNEEVSLKANRLLRFSLSRFGGVVSHVKTTFLDVNGPKGGIDKRCRITVKMKTSGLLVAQSDGVDYLEALSVCLDKITRVIRREIDKRRTEPIRIIRKESQLTLYNSN